MRTKLFVSILILQIFCGQLVFAQTDRGVANKQVGGKRLALVIGNGAYQHTSPLPNPSNDASAMKTTLESLGFEVIYGVNQNSRQMKALIRQFGDKLFETKGIGLFFYAGHGLAAGGENYLVPVDADIPAEDEIQDATVSLSFLLGKMATAGNSLNIVILDACRNNPFARKWRTVRDTSTNGGLATITRAPTGTLIAYATAPGEVASDGTGKNGLYTQELLKQIKTPNLPIEEVFKNVRSQVRSKSKNAQVPWESSSIEGQFYFAGGGGTPVPKPVPIINQPVVNVESEFWNAIKESTDLDDFKLYKNKYPNGIYADLADLKIKKLTVISPGTVISNSLGMKFAYSPPGTFQMGDSGFGPDQIADGSSVPLHMVTLTRGFYMGISEITQEQWLAVMGNNPSVLRNCNKCPVENVSWDDVQQFISKLNTRGEGIYRLPTEAEWEYAARAGMTVDIAENIVSMAWYSDNSGFRPHEVATRLSNGWGMYDMHGNVHEWVQDWDGKFSREAVNDPTGPASGSNRVLRGGSFGNAASNLRMAFRSREAPSFRSFAVGARVVRMK